MDIDQIEPRADADDPDPATQEIDRDATHIEPPGSTVAPQDQAAILLGETGLLDTRAPATSAATLIEALLKRVAT